jgi:hypothetical protein
VIHSEAELEKICSGNVLRVWSHAERVVTKLQPASRTDD